MDATTTAADPAIMADMARDIDSARVLWTVSDAADKLCVSRQTIYDWLDKGMPVAARYRYRNGWAPLFDPREARSWMESWRDG